MFDAPKKCIFVIYILTLMSNEVSAVGKYCETNSSAPLCPEGWTMTVPPRSCIRQTIKQLNWTAGRDYCRQQDADLLVSTNKGMREFLNDYLDRDSVKFYWLALNDREQEGQWTWKEDSSVDNRSSFHFGDPVVYTNWRYGHPSKGNDRARNHDCSIIDSDSGEFLETHCNLRYSHICQTPVNTKYDCPTDWWKTAEDLGSGKTVCIAGFDEKVTWLGAARRCRDINARLVTVETREKHSSLKDNIFQFRLSWLGLRTIEEKGPLVWINGEIISGRYKGKNCLLASGSYWPDESCEKWFGVLCQKLNSYRLADPKLKIRYHRRPNTLYLGQPMTAECTFLGLDTEHVTWAALDNKNNWLDTSASISHSIESITLDDGTCVNRWTSHYTVAMVTMAMKGMRLSCFAFDAPKNVICRNPKSDLSFCDSAEYINVVDGPKGRPELSLDYVGSPGPITAGKLMTATCTAQTGPDGMAMWVVSFKHGPVAVDPQDDKIILHNVTYDPKIQVSRDTSVLQFRIKVFMSRLVISCFAYNAVLFAERLQCLDTDPYCVNSQNISVQLERHDNDFWILFPGCGSFTALILVGVAATLLTFPISAFGEHDTHEGDDVFSLKLSKGSSSSGRKPAEPSLP